VSALVALAAGGAVLDQESGLGTWLHLRSELERADERLARLQEEIASVERQISALETDPFAVERAIREDLELARPGELVVRFQRDRRPPAAL